MDATNFTDSLLIQTNSDGSAPGTGTLSSANDNIGIGKDVFKAIWEGNGSVDEIIETQGLKQMTDVGAIEEIIDGIIANNSEQVEQYKAGNSKLFGYFVGQVMKASQGKANPKQVNQILNDKLS